ncbi:hypothetical protein [Bradyrhizobium cenepequi]|uniref:hypothetical protein n=1 Tax=Bradyrhizobium cenepequi TaxID=2821403 RepID=UPI001CE2BD25|nr:hypothetical protein [Bradyrhizobium cenepequi]MCA6112614.1 hypothetical protein [Bradyrhizobium cenepequi]
MEKSTTNLTTRARAEQRNLRLLTFWEVPTHPVYDLLCRMDACRDAIPDDVAALKEVLVVEREGFGDSGRICGVNNTHHLITVIRYLLRNMIYDST